MFQTCISMNSMIRNNHTSSFDAICSVTYITSGGTTSKILLSIPLYRNVVYLYNFAAGISILLD